MVSVAAETNLVSCGLDVLGNAIHQHTGLQLKKINSNHFLCFVAVQKEKRFFVFDTPSRPPTILLQ